MTHPLLRKFLFAVGCVVSGWIAAFSMPQVSFWPCLFVGLSGLYYFYSRTQGAGQAFLTGLLFALGYFVTGLWWIGNALLVEGNEFAWVWPISVIGLPTLLGLFTGTYLGIARLTAAPTSWKGFLTFSFFLTFSEWARGHAFTGFPWNLYGYVWSDHIAMAQSAHFIGAFGLTFVSVIWASLAGFLVISGKANRVKITAASAVILSMAAFYGLGQYRLNTHPTIFDKKNGVVIAQPNIAQDMKWDPVALQENFLKITSLSKDARFADPQPENIFIVWPETAISPAVYEVPENMDRIRALLNSYGSSNAHLVTGVLRRMEKQPGVLSYANSVVFLNKEMSALDVYDKYHLVPFGEFIPFQKWIPLTPVAAFKGFERGKGADTISHAGLPAFSPLICYEVIFPDEVVSRKKARPDMIVNVTNDGWYGDSAGPHQHFAQTRLRAIEEGLPVIRAANTGISGVIDSYGRVLEKADIFDEAAVVSLLPESIPDKNPWWPLFLQLMMPVIAIIVMLRVLVVRR